MRTLNTPQYVFVISNIVSCRNRYVVSKRERPQRGPGEVKHGTKYVPRWRKCVEPRCACPHTSAWRQAFTHVDDLLARSSSTLLPAGTSYEDLADVVGPTVRSETYTCVRACVLTLIPQYASWLGHTRWLQHLPEITAPQLATKTRLEIFCSCYS